MIEERSEGGGGTQLSKKPALTLTRALPIHLTTAALTPILNKLLNDLLCLFPFRFRFYPTPSKSIDNTLPCWFRLSNYAEAEEDPDGPPLRNLPVMYELILSLSSALAGFMDFYLCQREDLATIYVLV